MDGRLDRKHWWRDAFARLIITILGGVVAAVIIAVVIPAILAGDSTEEAPDQGDVPAEASDSAEDPGTEEQQAPAEGEPAATDG